MVVGRIGRPHGIRGEVTVEVRTDEPERHFVDGATLLLGTDVDGPVRPVTVARVHWHSGRLLLLFDGVHDRNGAEELRGQLILAERGEHETPDDPDEFYDSALEGCRVELADGTLVGVVREVIHLPSQDCLAVVRENTGEVLVPFVAEIVPIVDVTARRIVIDPPPGLLDEPDSDGGAGEGAEGEPEGATERATERATEPGRR